jgi:hypothetical protein
MKTRILIAAIAATTFATPALADFFIVREGASGPCHVVETRPTDARTIVVGNKAYTVRADAEREIAVVCAAPPAVVPGVESRQCFYQGRPFSDGATNQIGQVCEKGSWR